MSTKHLSRVLVAFAFITLAPAAAHATPSTTFWAPSTASCQARGVPHVTYEPMARQEPATGRYAVHVDL